MSDRLEELGTDTVVVLITFTDHANLQRYQDRHRLPFPVLIDADRSAYRAFGLGRGSTSRVWGWRAARRYWELLSSGALADLARPTEDTRQLGGDFVIGPDGTLVYGFWGAGPDDRPPVEDLVEAIRAIGR